MISRFKEKYGFLSNFAEVPVTFEGEVYRSVEHAYVASKTLNEVMRFEIRSIPTAGQAKTFGKTLLLREDWKDVRLGIIEDLLRQKFAVKEFGDMLLETDSEELVEGNTWHDNFWGSCICENCGDKGENNLGELLMKIREEVRQPSLF